MAKLDWTSRNDRFIGAGNGKPVAMPYVQQGVRDALRNAYRRSSDDVPADMEILLNRMS